MSSRDFEALPKNEQKQVVDDLHSYQKGRCYICEESIDLSQPMDVDHIRSKDQGGIVDSRNNWGLTHEHCNRAKGNRDLDLQRYLVRFQKARRGHLASGQSEDTFTVGVALGIRGGAKRETVARIEGNAEGNEHLARIIHEEARGEQELGVWVGWWGGGCRGARFAKAERSDLVLGWW